MGFYKLLRIVIFTFNKLVLLVCGVANATRIGVLLGIYCIFFYHHVYDIICIDIAVIFNTIKLTDFVVFYEILHKILKISALFYSTKPCK